MGCLHYKGYTGCVEYDEKDNYFFGHVLGLRGDGISYEGTTAEGLKRDFEESVDDYLSYCAETGKAPEKPFSGKLVIRMTSSLHREATEKASTQGISLNEFINRAIASAVL